MTRRPDRRPTDQPASAVSTGASAAAERALGELLAPEGWAYASSPPVEPGDPGRFHALFGRDALIVALQVLPLRPEIADATLRSLAALRGRCSDPDTEEEPGRMLHEYRPVAPSGLVEQGWPTREGGIRYYGSADATSWFLVVLAARGDRGLAAELHEAWTGAGAWLEGALDRGAGLIRSGPRTRPGGLSQQGWRDTRDPQRSHGGGILRADGSSPRSPLADADSQAAAVAALRALTWLDPGRAAHWRGLESRLRARVTAAFGPEVIALEADDTPVPGAGSHLGWLLWSGALDDDAVEQAADRLTQPDVLSPFGVRTLSSRHPQFRAHAYHRGGVWPFDSWLSWGGLRAAGHEQAAEQVRRGVLAALETLGRAPELYAVTQSGRLESIARSNRVQAWTVGAAWALANSWDGRAVSVD
jgi:glycogen debranching enzyme